MEWLANNWVWILLGVGFVWFLSRGRGGMGCCGGGHSHGPSEERPEKEKEKAISTKGSCH